MTTTTPIGERPHPPIGFLLKELDGLIDRRFELALGARGVTRRQWQLLRTLAEGPADLDALDAAVAPFLDLAAGASAAPHLEPLLDRGMVTVTDGVHDLSDDGKELVRELTDAVHAIRRLTTQGVTEDAYDCTVATLQTMVHNLRPG